MSIEQEIAGLTQSTTDLLDAVNTKKATLDTAVSNAQTAVTDATSQVSLAAAEKVGAEAARDEAETHKDQAYTYSQSAASAVAYQDLTAIAESKAETAVDVFVYDTRKDSDGGAWRKRTQGTSWYNEPLNTATRGSRKEFPAVAVIVAESSKVTIYDGDDPSMPMWMVFNSGGSTVDNINHLSTPSANIYTVSGMNGIICPCGAGGYMRFDFIKDVSTRTNASNTSLKIGGISERNNGRGQIVESSIAIVNGVVNDVAMTVLPDAPIDPATGLPIPTIAVATDGGVSVIKDDGTVVDITFSNGNTVLNINFDNDYNVVFGVDFSSSAGGRYIKRYIIPESDLNEGSYAGLNSAIDSSDNFSYSPSTNPSYLHPRGFVSDDNETLNIAFAAGYQSQWVGLLKKNFKEDLVNATTSTYNTGWMNGDIKLATLSDTDDTDLVGTELVTNGTFDTDTSGWTALDDTTLSNSNGELLISAGTANLTAGAYQSVPTVAGSLYTLSFDFTQISGSAQVRMMVAPNSGTIESLVFNSSGSYSITFIAATTTSFINLIYYNSQGQSGKFDNVSVRLAEPDRSVNGNGLQVFGTVTKSPVATGADLVAYSGFSSTNYLVQPYNPDLDFGAGDFCVMGWYKTDNTTEGTEILFSRVDTGNVSAINLLITSSETLTLQTRESSTSSTTTTTETAPTGVWNCFTFVRRNSGTVQEIYINGKLSVSGTVTARNMSSSTGKVYMGYTPELSANAKGSMALWRVSATVPTAEQVAKIYRDEKPLFQENAQATLHGTSDAVTALAFDQYTDLLHVGTSAGRSVFSGLQRVDNTTDAVGTAISASDNFIAEE